MKNIRDELESVSNFFDIGKVEVFTRLGGVANENFSVRTTNGNYVVKFVREHSADNLKTVAPFFRAIEHDNFPTAYYLRNSAGEFVFDKGSTVAVVMHEEKGTVPDTNNQTVYVMGETLARLHSVPAEGLKTRLTWFNPEFLPQGLTDLDSRIDSKTVRRLRRAFEKIGSIENTGLRKSIVHGDFHPGNLLFCEEKLEVVLDWEEVSFGPSLIDIAYAIFIMFFEGSKFNAEHFSSFMNGYQSVRILSQNERNSLSTFVQFVGLTVSTWIFLRFGVNSSDPISNELANRYWTADLENWEIRELHG
jgi:Ser/Thr protein kinase RdoA (MazF antagonist)